VGALLGLLALPDDAAHLPARHTRDGGWLVNVAAWHPWVVNVDA
jgi:hypothetical protein